MNSWSVSPDRGCAATRSPAIIHDLERVAVTRHSGFAGPLASESHLGKESAWAHLTADAMNPPNSLEFAETLDLLHPARHWGLMMTQNPGAARGEMPAAGLRP